MPDQSQWLKIITEYGVVIITESKACRYYHKVSRGIVVDSLHNVRYCTMSTECRLPSLLIIPDYIGQEAIIEDLDDILDFTMANAMLEDENFRSSHLDLAKFAAEAVGDIIGGNGETSPTATPGPTRKSVEFAIQPPTKRFKASASWTAKQVVDGKCTDRVTQ
jgi:hypothetical protein